MEFKMAVPKPVKVLGALVILAALAGVYMFLMHLEPRDFVRMPDGVLDDAVYYAQQRDLKAFKRIFTKDIQQKMQDMHDNNTNRDVAAGIGEQAELSWTWDTLMDRMSKLGGFEVKPTSTKFLDYMIDGKAKLEIVYVDEDSNKERNKNFTLYRNDLVWRIDLSSDPDFVKAYNQSVRSFRNNNSNNQRADY